MTTTVGEGLKRRITFKIKEEEMAKQQQDQGGNGPSIVSMVNN